MWLSEETGPRHTERGWAGMSLQPAHAAASGEDMGTKWPSGRPIVGHWTARQCPWPGGCNAISNKSLHIRI